MRSHAVGIGIARAPALPSLTGRNAGHVEAFVRRGIADVLYLTGSVQWLSESAFGQEMGSGIWIFACRASATFP